jgi:ArsR family transcriptional regulator
MTAKAEGLARACRDGYQRLLTEASSSLGNGHRSVDDLFRALADRTRLRILHLLLHGEICVGDLATVLQLSQPRTSQHLACLRHTELVVARREGLWTHYCLAPPSSPFHEALLETMKLGFAGMPELAEDNLRYKDLGRLGRCCP